MTRFIALPVVAGDAFYLERKDFSVLVDGGMNLSSFAQLFERTVKKTRADIVVCTHNDADHANGIINFLESGYGCGEVWLPGRWADCIEGLMQPEREAISIIVEGAAEHWQSEEIFNREVIPSFEEIGERLADKLNGSENNNSDYRDARNDDYIDNPKYLRNSTHNQTREINEVVYDENNDWLQNEGLSIRSSIRYGSFLRRRISYDVWQDWSFWGVVEKAIEAGNRIKRIAQAAYSNGIPIRWFDHTPSDAAAVNASASLLALSARRISGGRMRPNLSLFHFLSLSTVNKESLVLYSPADSVAPGVLFCADSDLQDIQIPLRENDLVTVPHHGSEANEFAYGRIKKSLPNSLDSLVWVRSDRLSNSRPCLSYKNLRGQKFCTVCRAGVPKQAVKMSGANNLWRRQNNVRFCNC